MVEEKRLNFIEFFAIFPKRNCWDIYIYKTDVMTVFDISKYYIFLPLNFGYNCSEIMEKTATKRFFFVSSIVTCPVLKCGRISMKIS